MDLHLVNSDGHVDGCRQGQEDVPRRAWRRASPFFTILLIQASHFDRHLLGSLAFSLQAPQTIAVLQSRAKGFKLKVVVGSIKDNLADPAIAKDLCGIMLQYPDVNGEIQDWEATCAQVHKLGGQVTVASDLLALTMLKVSCFPVSHTALF